jgi:hypothetical protein
VEREYTNNERFIADLVGGGSVFVKHAVDTVTADWLRREHQMYAALAGHNLAPDLVGWVDGELPTLVLEDLSGADWPPPWSRDQIEAVRLTLERVAALVPPTALPRLEDGEPANEGWNRVLVDPREFLSLGLFDADWVARLGPVLVAASAAAPLAGTALLHNDVRSDNVCVDQGVGKLFDWNLACIGNPQFDIAFWTPSLALETGLAPEVLMPDCAPELVACVAGFFASRAGQPVVPHAPLVRQVQLGQLQVALP